MPTKQRILGCRLSHRRGALALAGAFLGVALAACGGGGSTASSSTTAGGAPNAGSDAIVIQGFAFHPATLTVAAGATVTVKNEDDTDHTVTAQNKAFDTGDIPAHSSKTFTAPKAGTYSYMCNIHQYMHATLTVSG